MELIGTTINTDERPIKFQQKKVDLTLKMFLKFFEILNFWTMTVFNIQIKHSLNTVKLHQCKKNYLETRMYNIDMYCYFHFLNNIVFYDRRWNYRHVQRPLTHFSIETWLLATPAQLYLRGQWRKTINLKFFWWTYAMQNG